MAFHEPKLLTLQALTGNYSYLVHSNEEIFLVMASFHRKRWQEGFFVKPQKPYRDAQEEAQVKELVKLALTLPPAEQSPVQREAQETLREWQAEDDLYEDQLATWKLLQAVVEAPTLKEAAALTTPDGRNYAFEVMEKHCSYAYENRWSLSSLEPLPTEE